LKKKYELWKACMGSMSLAMFNRCFRLLLQAVESCQQTNDAEGWIKSQARVERVKEGNWKGRF
jgi:hypothetical protein